MRILIPGFTGLNQRLAPQRLEDTEATVAVDCDFRTGDLRGYLADASTSVPNTGNKTAPATLFKYDTTLLVTPGAYDFVRSPTSYSNASSSQRVFFAPYPGVANNGAGDTAAYQINATDILDGQGLPAVYWKLGIPEPPGPINGDLISFDVQSGAISFALLYSQRPKQTGRDIKIITASAHGLKAGDKVVVDYPGVPTTAASVKIVSGTEFTLNGTGKAWNTACDLTFGTSPIVKIKGTHKLQVGDQIILDYINSDANRFNIARGSRWVVTEVSTSALAVIERLTDAGDTDTSHNHTAGTSDSITSLGFFLLSYAALPAQGVTRTVTTYLDKLADVLVTLNDYADGTWNNAATVDIVRDRAYLCTYVNAYGDESAPSQATETLSVVPGTPVTFAALALPYRVSVESPGYPSIAKWRLYRTDETGQWRFLMDVTYAADSPVTVDDMLDTALGEPLSTTGWATPPDGMTGLVSAPNGVVAGFLDKTVIPSVPFAPYAFPVAYQQSVDYPIMGLVTTGAGLAVLTQGLPYLLIGTDPANWSMQKLEVPQACVSHQSIVDMGDFAIYASPDGLVAIDGSTVQLLTGDLLTRAQWQAYNPSTIVAAHAEGRYIATWQPASGPRQGFIFDTKSGTFTATSNAAIALFNDLLTDSLYQLHTDGSVTIWNRGTTTGTYAWRSKQFQLPRPTNLAAAQVILADYSATTTLQIYVGNLQTPLFVDGVGAPAPMTLTDETPFRLPGGYMVKDYWIELIGSGWVQGVGIASSVAELKEAP